MKARIVTELVCGGTKADDTACNGRLHYHKDIYVKCNTLKCDQRGVLYHAPAFDLVAFESDEIKKQKAEAKKAAAAKAKAEAKAKEEAEVKADD